MQTAVETIHAFLTDASALAERYIGTKSGGKVNDTSQKLGTIAAVAIFLATMPIDMLQIACMFFGAFVLWFIQGAPERKLLSFTRTTSKCSEEIAKEEKEDNKSPKKYVPASRSTQMAKPRLPKPTREDQGNGPSPATTSAPLLSGKGWEADVHELLEGYLRPNPESDNVVAAVTAMVQQHLQGIFPGVEAKGFAITNVRDNLAHGMLVPEIDIVLNINQDALFEHVLEKCLNKNAFLKAREMGQLNSAKLRKSGIRSCTEVLCSRGFKFARSKFRGFDPRVTMVMVGTHSGLRLGMSGQLSFDLSVTSPVPPFVKVLVDACAKMDSRALDLIYLVRRWAKIRGLCFAPRGYLPPYLWTIMTIFFLQVRQRGEGAVLPPLKIAKGSWGFSVTSRLPRWKEPDAEKASHTAHSTSTGELLKEFFNFYAKEFDGTAEVISMTAGKRDASATARMRLPAQVIYHEDGVQQTVALTIEDPLNNQRALRTPVTWTSLARITEELSRAATLSEREQDCSAFVDLLQLWNGGENDQENDEDDQDNDGLQ